MRLETVPGLTEDDLKWQVISSIRVRPKIVLESTAQ